ncbi:MAG: ring-cleaving dioxygenase [Acholeplasma sp.]|jgi:glyoxalase family protein|nr:MAG: ring-cleaving dioxygenase [Acholeplasma sp.]
MKPLLGIHHVTAMTSSAEKIYHFFTYILGIRLVKKTINQDDIQTYHLFFADDEGHAGTDMTFFDFPGSSKAIRGTNEIAKTGFRVPSDQAIHYWKKRFEKLNVKHHSPIMLFNRLTLEFIDFDDQVYVLFSDQNNIGLPSGKPWKKGPIPDEYAITGLGPIFFRVNQRELMDIVLTEKLTFKRIDQEGSNYLYQTGDGGNGASVIVMDQPGLPLSRQGYGGVHHVAFGVNDDQDIFDWMKHLSEFRAPHSGFVDRFYFHSLYTRLYPGILFEFATMGPGFIDDEESYETLGETLALPPRFRNERAYIESLVRPIDTRRSHLKLTKEYMED